MTTLQTQNGHIQAQPAVTEAPVPPGRRRGGQPGNQNARKHGFYAKALTLEEQETLQQALDLNDLVPEIALMRVKLIQLVSYPDTSTELFIKAARILTRMVDIQHRLALR